jgi:hypothetical protein
MVAQAKPLAEITQEAVKILFEKLGPVNTVRFINQFHAGYGDYVAEKEALFGEKTLGALVEEIKESRREHP